MNFQSKMANCKNWWKVIFNVSVLQFFILCNKNRLFLKYLVILHQISFHSLLNIYSFLFCFFSQIKLWYFIFILHLKRHMAIIIWWTNGNFSGKKENNIKDALLFVKRQSKVKKSKNSNLKIQLFDIFQIGLACAQVKTLRKQSKVLNAFNVKCKNRVSKKKLNLIRIMHEREPRLWRRILVSVN